jgi:tetratricopeptide (TPR) repeat protein
MVRIPATLLLSTATLVGAGAAENPVANPAPPPVQASAATASPASDQRMEVYDQFREKFKAGRYDEALPLAQRVVELSELDRDRDLELPVAYNNLGATQFQLRDLPAAEASYRMSLEFLEANQGISSSRLIVPLAGLGAVYAALDKHDLAVPLFDRALAVSRRADGLFNLAQLPIIEQAARSLFAVGDYPGVEREYFYALRIAEQNYGFDDVRTIPAALQLASFYESVKEFAAARGLYLRVRDISMKESGGFNPTVIRSLIAIGRTHRMQFTMEPESLNDNDSERDVVTGDPYGRDYQNSRSPTPVANRSGLKSIEQALQLLRAAPDPPRRLLADTLTEMGDWYQATSREAVAAPFYAEASAVYAADPEGGNPLLVPRLIAYRPPLAAKRSFALANGDVTVRKAEFSLTVDESGNPQSVTVVTSDMLEGQLAQSRRALERAIYSPRFENGKPVATEGIRFSSEWHEKRQPEKPSATN